MGVFNGIRGIWRALRQPSGRWTMGGLLATGCIVGVLGWGGFNWGVEFSNSEAFCISCHEMRSTVYQELQKTVHWENPSGVRAICSDCHVPKAWHLKMGRKIAATFNELPKHIFGVMNTREAFEERRLEMATSVWASMKATNSRECRNCHRFESMTMDWQMRAAQRNHERALKDGSTCIDCHQGIAHELPKDWKDAYNALPR